MAVLVRPRWRRTWPISASGTPARTISQARVWRRRCAPTGATPARTQARRTIEDTPPRPRAAIGAVALRNSSRLVVFGRPRHLAGAKAKAQQGDDEPVIPPTDRPSAVAGAQQRFGVRRADPPRQRRGPPAGHGQRRGAQVGSRQPLDAA